jgi:hypothetical protein
MLGITTPSPPKPPDKPVGGLKRVDDKFLQKHNIDAHELKRANVGNKGTSEYDIYRDRDGNLWLQRKDGTGEPIFAYETVK